MHYASTSSDNVTDRAGNVLPGRQLSVYRTKDQTQPVTNLIQNGEPTTVLVTDINGEFVFEQPDNFPEPLWARTALGTWYRLVSDETQDQVGPMVAQFPGVRDTANTASAAATEALRQAGNAGTQSSSALDTANRLASAAGVIFDITKTRPEFAVEFTGGGIDVYNMQCAVKTSTGEWYISVAKADGTFESVTVYRHAANGDYIDEMKLHWAGHGTTIGVQEKPDGIYLWLPWQSTPGDAQTLMQVKYQPGVTAEWNSAGVIPFDRFMSNYIIVSIDQDNDRMAFRITTGGGAEAAESYQLRRLSDVESGIDDVLGEVPGILFSDATPQGFCTIDDHMYRVVGTGGPQRTAPNTIEQWSWVTGTKVATLDVQYVGSTDGSNGFMGKLEPEGVTIFRDPLNKQVALMYGVVSGSATSGRHNVVYQFAQTRDVRTDKQTRFSTRRPVDGYFPADGNYNPVPLPIILRDSGIPWDPTLNQFTILEDGAYVIFFTAAIVQPNQTGSRYVGIQVNGTKVSRVGGPYTTPTNGVISLFASIGVPLKRGDLVQPVFYHGSGVPVGIDGDYSSFTITRVG